MYIVLGTIMLLVPVFLIIGTWVSWHKQIWFRVINTVAMVLGIIMLISFGNTTKEMIVCKEEYRKQERVLDYVAQRDKNYLICVANVNPKDVVKACVIPMAEEIAKIFDN